MMLFHRLRRRSERAKQEEAEPERLSFAEWTKLVEDTLQAGDYSAAAVERMKDGFPSDYSAIYDPELADLMGRLETRLLSARTSVFAEAWARGIEEGDITRIRSAWNRLFASYQNALFFRECPGFPEEISRQLEQQVWSNATRLQADCEKSVRRIEAETGSDFMKDVLYVLRKNKMEDL